MQYLTIDIAVVLWLEKVVSTLCKDYGIENADRGAKVAKKLNFFNVLLIDCMRCRQISAMNDPVTHMCNAIGV